MSSFYRPSDFMRRTLALAVVLGAGAAVAGAQTGVVAVDAQTAPALNLQVPAVDTSNANLFSSSADNSAESVNVASVNHINPFANAMQYGGGSGRRYGRPRYRGGNTNQDGSARYAFFVGAGATAPVTDESKYLKTSWGFQVGGGRNFNKNFGLMAQFDWDNFGFTGRTISSQSYVYTGSLANTYNIDGNTHIWSFSLNPTFYLPVTEGLGAYFVVGGGFYHKNAKFFVPSQGTAYSPYYGYYTYTANQTFDEYNSNSVGVNGGVGLTYKLSRFSKEQLYAEVRAVHTFNKYRPGVTTSSTTTAGLQPYNYFPANSNETTYLPLKVGIRF